MKRVLAMVLCLAMVLVMTSVAAFAMDEVAIVGATMQDPKNDFPKICTTETTAACMCTVGTMQPQNAVQLWNWKKQ